jgi:hypothetical protein
MAIKTILMLSLPAYAEASAGQLNVLVRRSLGEGGSKHARCRSNFNPDGHLL